MAFLLFSRSILVLIYDSICVAIGLDAIFWLALSRAVVHFPQIILGHFSAMCDNLGLELPSKH